MEDQQQDLPEVQPKVSEPTAPTVHEISSKPRLRRLTAWYAGHKKYSIPATIIILVAILAGVPFTRYHVAGLVLKKSFTLQVSDSTANTPVSGALVSIGGVTGTTDGNGKITLKSVKIGSQAAIITKKYYKSGSSSVLVPILKQKTVPDIFLVATGRQVKIKVTDLINTKALDGVQITIADTTAKTGVDGSATVVLPANSSSQKAALSDGGYNNASVTVKISDKGIAENDFKLTPTGKIYYLSDDGNGLDVKKANLDGTGAQTVVASNGTEDPTNTVLLQSSDGKYVALVSKRSANDATPQLYVLATADDKLLQADSGNASFTMTGWVGDSLIYTAQRNDLPAWQQGLNKLKSYDASTGKNTVLDQSAGSDATLDVNENYQLVMLAGATVVYGKTWSNTTNTVALTGKQNTLHTVNSDGQNSQVVASYPAIDYVSFIQHSPVAVYIQDQTPDQASSSYFDYTAGGSPKSISLTTDQLYANDYFFYFSPSNNQTFWDQPRNGKIALLLGDSNGANSKTIGSLGDYSPYGWYTDNYLLVTKNDSELYIMDTHGDPAVKVTDFQPTTGLGY